MNKHNKLPIVQGVPILDIADQGQAVAKVKLKPSDLSETVIFIKDVVPGDVVDVQLTKKRKNFAEGIAINFQTYSADRIAPFCIHFAHCGGCKWQYLDYQKQLFYKHKQVLEAFTRIGKVELPTITPILASPQQTYYRNKMEFTFSNNKWLTKEDLQTNVKIEDRNALGLHVPRFFDKVLDLQQCHLQAEPSNQIRLAVREFATKHNYTFFDIRKQENFLRNLLIRTTLTGDLMVLLSFFYSDPEKQNALLEYLHQTFPQITSLLYVVNPKGNDTIYDLDVKCYSGKPYIIEQLGDLKFKIGAKSFFQTNTLQTLQLYQTVVQFAQIKQSQIVYDLYSGTGTIANFVAQSAAKVIGIELLPEAIDDARENARLNGITNVHFEVGDMKNILTEKYFEIQGNPDVIILDPPRAGLHTDVIDTLIKIKSPRIIYVSCNPATQARDVNLLSHKYNITAMQPVDMFPHTHHVENIALLQLKNS